MDLTLLTREYGSLFALLIIGVVTLYNQLFLPYFKKRAEMLIEKEKSDKEVKKINEDIIWKQELREEIKAIINVVRETTLNHIDYTSAQFIYTFFMRENKLDLYVKLLDFIDKNDIKSKDRRKIIHGFLIADLEEQKCRMLRVYENYIFNGRKLSNYIDSITEEHTLEFVDEIETILFNQDLEVLRKKDDLRTFLNTHYSKHISEAIEKLKLN